MVRRVDPSPYPGSDSTEFTNEPLYLNFDINNNVDSGRVRRIHYSFGNEVFLLISAGRSAANAGDRTIFARFFEDSASKAEAVTQVFDSLRDENGDPQSLVNSFIFDNTDFGGLCLASNTTFGYTAFDDDTDGLEKTHFCASAFAFPDLNKIACGTLDAYPSARMDNLARIMLNVFVKYSTVGLVTEVYQPIVDVTNNDGLTAYYPSRTHGLLVQDGRGSAADVNADNYAWLGQVRFFPPFFFRNYCVGKSESKTQFSYLSSLFKS